MEANREVPPHPALQSNNASANRYIRHNFSQPITDDRSCIAITAMHNDRIHLKARWTIKYMLKYQRDNKHTLKKN